MSIRTNYTGNPRTQRKIDQAYEMASLARQDGDRADELRWLDEAKRLQQGE